MGIEWMRFLRGPPEARALLGNLILDGKEKSSEECLIQAAFEIINGLSDALVEIRPSAPSPGLPWPG